jgi:hypothetical protein
VVRVLDKNDKVRSIGHQKLLPMFISDADDYFFSFRDTQFCLLKAIFMLEGEPSFKFFGR